MSVESKLEAKKLKWVRIDERNDTSVFPAVFFQSGAGESPMKRALGTSLEALMQSFEGRKWVWFEVEGDLQRVARELIRRIEENPGFVSDKIEETYGFAKPLLELTSEIASANLKEKSDDELADYYASYARRLEAMRGPAWIAPALDASEFFSSHLKDILRGYLKKLGRDGESDVAQYFVALTAPEKQTLLAQNDEALLEIAVSVARNAEQARFFKENELEFVVAELPKRFPALDAAFERHRAKFEWLPCTYENDAWTKAHFVSVVRQVVAEGNAQQELSKLAEKRYRAIEAKKKAFNELGLSAGDAAWFNAASKLIFFKADRKDVFFKSYYQMRPLIREIAERLRLSVSEVRMMLPSEVDEYLRSGSVSTAFRETLRARREFSVLLSFDDDSIVLTGEEARRYLKENLVKEDFKETSELKGSTANVGSARGIARLIFSPKDLPKMKQGDVLVAPATNPDVVPAMKKAAAIVTNTGGITCHAAIVSRELGIPCVVGTKRATDVIKDGDVVEVDATAGIVKIVKRAGKN